MKDCDARILSTITIDNWFYAAFCDFITMLLCL